jgi:hypothetical protein
MSNNIFKTDRKPNNGNNDRHYLSNSFRSTREPVVQKFEIKDEDFPELCVEGQNKKENVLQYKNATLKSNEVEEEQPNNLKPGWTRIYYDKNRKLVIENYDYYYDEDFHTCAKRGIQTLIDKWENERINYNNLYGEGEYERIYYMPRREEYNCYDNDSDDEDYFVEQATKDEYNEDDPQYYDLY